MANRRATAAPRTASMSQSVGDLVHVGERLVGLDVRGADAGADDADPEAPHRFRAPSATPRMIRRWKARKTTKTGTSDRADMAKSSP